MISSPSCLLPPSRAHQGATPRNRACLFNLNLRPIILPRNFRQRSVRLPRPPYATSSSRMLQRSLLLLRSGNQNNYPCSRVNHRSLREQIVFPCLSRYQRLLRRADILRLHLLRDQLPTQDTPLRPQAHQQQTRDIRPLHRKHPMLVISPNHITT